MSLQNGISGRTRLMPLIIAVVLMVPLSWARQGEANRPEQADRIVIYKSAHTMTLMKGGRSLSTYRVALGRDPVGAKLRIGDHKTPEGSYVVDRKNSQSRFHLALHLSYPNETDRLRASRLGVDPGGDVEIHGIQNGLGLVGSLHRRFDWTDGCVAVTDEEIEEIWNKVSLGTLVEIKP